MILFESERNNDLLSKSLSKAFLLAVGSSALLTACSIESLVVSIKNKDIIGSAPMFQANGSFAADAGSLSVACTSAVATLHALKANGSIDPEILSSGSIDIEGNYKISVSSSSPLTSPQVQHVIKASGCGAEFCRPVTDFKDQIVSGASTLVCMASEVDGNRSLKNVGREELDQALNSLSTHPGASTLLDILNSVITNTSLASTYKDITGIAADKLKELPPRSLSYTAPLQIHESTANTYSVSANHWNSDYEVAYEWKLDGVTVATSTTYTYTTGVNSQGAHTLVVTLGSKNNGGSLDATKPTKSQTFNVIVQNDYPALAPSFTLASPTDSGIPISTRSLTLGISTGLSQSHCATFSKMAITENKSTKPTPEEFTISCSTAGTQSQAYTLTSPGDGPKVLRLWAMDSAGNISASPSSLNLNLDTAAPSASITSTLPSITNSTSQSLSFSASDNGGSIAYFECKLNGGSYSACSSPKTFSGLSQGLQTLSVRAVDTATNTSPAVTASWIVDLTPPTLTFSGTPASVTNSLVSSFNFSGNDTGGGSIARYECKLDGGNYSPCNSPKIDVLTTGPHTLLVKAFDTAGNVSDVSSYSWTIDTTGPTVTIASKPAAITNSQTPSFNFNGSDSGGGTVTNYECSLDGGSYSPCSSPRIYSAISAGGHVFAVRAVDSAGNIGVPTTYAWTIDLTTPMASINSGPDTITNATSATFSFSANPPPSGSITGYQCSVDGAPFTSCSSPKTYTSLGSGSHSFSVRSVDNNSAVSAVVSETWLIDTTPPVVTMSSAPSSINNSSTASLTFDAADGGGGVVSGFECKLNTGPYAACTSPVNLSGLAEGTYTYDIRAIDSAGNISSAVTASWTVDLTGPTLTLTSSPFIITNSSEASFGFSGVDSGGSTLSIYQCSLNGAAFTSCSSPALYGSLAAGVHTFAVKAFDAVGNSSPTTSYSWTIDKISPTVTLSSFPNSNSNSTSASFTFSGSDSGGGSIAGYECSIDGNSYSSCVSPKSFSSLPSTSHTFYVRSLDTAGNTGAPLSYTWAIDTTAPSLSVITPGADGFLVPSSSVSSFLMSGTCESGLPVVFSGTLSSSTTCSSGAWAASLNLSALSDGAMSVTATQTDIAGNTTSRTRTFVKDTSGPIISLTSVPTTPQKGVSAVLIGFSVTEANITTAQTFRLSYSSNNGSTWTEASSTVSSTAGPLTAATFNYNLTLPSVDTSQFKVRVSGEDAAGNSAISTAGSAFTVDSTAPALTDFRINDNAALTLSPLVTVKLNATDTNSGVSAIRIANANPNCQSAYNDDNWQNFVAGGGIQSYSATTNFSNGIKVLCAWAKDVAGNVSVISANGGAGTEGQDTDSINLDMGSAPTFTSLVVTNNNPASGYFGTTTFATGDQVNISFTVTDDAALATAPVRIEVSTNNSSYTPIASAATVGTISAGQTSWTKTYTGYNAPAGTYFRIRAVAQDANGNTTYMSSGGLNTGKWSYYAGSSDIGDGGSALSARLNMRNYMNGAQNVAVNSRNEIFLSTTDGIRKIDPATGIISTYIRFGTSEVGVPGTLTSSTRVRDGAPSLLTDGDFLYFEGLDRLYRVNTADDSIIVYAGGGSSVTTTDPSAMYFWPGSVFTMDPVTKDIYATNTCDASVTSGNSSTVSIKIQKITQNSSTKLAQSVSDWAGNCNKGTATAGTDQMNTPLENSVYRNSHGSMVYVPSTGALYFAPISQRILKFIGGKVYPSTDQSSSGAGAVYLSSENKVYWILSNGDVYPLYRFTPNANAAFDEVFSLYIKRDTECADASCRQDGKHVSEAGIMGGTVFALGSQLGFVDGLRNGDGPGKIRIVDAITQTVQTLAGLDRFWGDNEDRRAVRFGGIRSLQYKTSNTSNFPAGLYVGDGLGNRLVHIDPATDRAHVRAGNGIGKIPDSGALFSPTSNVGRIRLASDLGLFTINPLGMFTYYTSYYLLNVKSDQTLEYFFGPNVSGGPSIYSLTDGSSAPASARFCNDGADIKHGLVYDAAGNLYFGGYHSACSPAPNKIMMRKSDGTYYTVIGNTTVASSADCATPGCAKSLSINASSATEGTYGNPLGVFDNRYAGSTGRLLFAEGNKIRFVANPSNPASSTYGTLLDAGRSVGYFLYRYVNPGTPSDDSIDRVFYISNDGKLYCYKVSAGTDVNCNNTSLGPHSPMETISTTSEITEDPSGNIYVTSGKFIYRYAP